MTTTAAAGELVGSPRIVQTILLAGLICGVLDGFAATVLSGFRFVPLWQFVASGLLGPASYQGGGWTAALGLACHFCVALSAATVYVLASRRFAGLITHPLLFGPLLGLGVHLFMNFVVIPLTAIGWRGFHPRSFFIQLAVHMLIVGPSIALTTRYCSK